MVFNDTTSPPSEDELRAEIRRLQYFLACWNVPPSGRQAAQLSIRIARAALAAVAGGTAGAWRLAPAAATEDMSLAGMRAMEALGVAGGFNHRDVAAAYLAMLATAPPPPVAAADRVARVLLADLQHMVHWHDQLAAVDIRRAEATISEATRIFGGESPTARPAPVHLGSENSDV